MQPVVPQTRHQLPAQVGVEALVEVVVPGVVVGLRLEEEVAVVEELQGRQLLA
jgi:hypothetical protein